MNQQRTKAQAVSFHFALMAVSAAGLIGCAPPDSLSEAERADRVESPIVNGQTTTGDPAVVYLDVGCTGTLVSPRVVLTACHCLENRNSANVFFGSNKNQQGTWISSAHLQIMNPNQCIGDGDIAMITLSQTGPAEPIPINDRSLTSHVGEDVRLVGFGVTGGNSGGSGIKREGGTKLHNLESGVMWVGGQNSGFCYGDSGGPNLMVFEGVEHVAGVTSFTTQNCSGVANDGSARTDKYITWIRDYIDQHDPGSCDADGRCATDCTAPDPDCPCEEDGFCTDLCPDLASDVDCDGCGVDGVCRADCPELDTDCCAADGNCFDACGSLDPDCAPDVPADPPDPTDPGDPSDPGNGNGNGNGNGSGHGSGPHGDALDDNGLTGSVTCGVSPARPTPSGWRWWPALAVLVVMRRRR